MKSKGMMWVEEMLLLHHLYFQRNGGDGEEMERLSRTELKCLERYANMIKRLVRGS